MEQVAEEVSQEAEHSEATEQESGIQSQIVTFKLADEEYGVNIMKVQEIILIGEITQVPEVPEFIEGVINLRGNVIPIVDLRKRFQLPDAPHNEDTRIIVINIEEKTMGVIVDEVNQVLRIADNEIDVAPATITGIGKEYLQGLVKLEGRLLILLDIEKILDLNEQQMLQEMANN